MGRREHRRHGLALRRVARLVHRDEALAAQIRRHVADRDAAERCGRGEHRMVGLDVHDVVVAGDRPVRPEHRVLAVMHRILAAQPVEIRPEGIGLEQLGMAGIVVRQRQCVGAFACGVQMGGVDEIDGPVHERLLNRCSSRGIAGAPCFTELHSHSAVCARADSALLAALVAGQNGRIRAFPTTDRRRRRPRPFQTAFDLLRRRMRAVQGLSIGWPAFRRGTCPACPRAAGGRPSSRLSRTACRPT